MADKIGRYAVQLPSADADAAVAGRALAGEPILVFPYGRHYREGFEGVYAFEVTPEVVAQAVENFARREERGVRQALLPVNEDHTSSRALGWFMDVVALPEGLGAAFSWNRRGREALEGGEFAYFSLEFAWEMVDRATGQVVTNQVVGGALTNYPFFGQAAALMSRNQQQEVGMAEALETVRAERDGLLSLIRGLFGRVTPAGGGTEPANTPGADDALQARVAAMERDLHAVQSERDAYRTQLAEVGTSLSAVTEARAREHFAQVVRERFSHLPAPLEQLAGAVRWLEETGGEHAQVVLAVLSAADGQFAQAFKERGVQPQGLVTIHARVDALVAQYQAAHPGVDSAEALRGVMREHPDVYEAYRAEVGDGRS